MTFWEEQLLTGSWPQRGILFPFITGGPLLLEKGDVGKKRTKKGRDTDWQIYPICL